MGSYYAGISRYLKHSRPEGSKNGYTTMEGYIPGEPAEGILINGRYYYEDELRGPNNAVSRAILEMDADSTFKENAMKVLKLPKKSWPDLDDDAEDTKKEDEEKPSRAIDLSPAMPSATAVSATETKKKRRSSSKKTKKKASKKKSKKNEKVPILENVSDLTGSVSRQSEEFIKNLIAQQSKKHK